MFLNSKGVSDMFVSNRCMSFNKQKFNRIFFGQDKKKSSTHACNISILKLRIVLAS